MIVIKDDPAPETSLFKNEKLRNLSIPPGALFVNADLMHRLEHLVVPSANEPADVVEPSANEPANRVEPPAN